MSLFGSSRDDRRRRNLAEDRSGDSTPIVASTAPLKTGGKQQRYTPAARRENHRRTSDFIPRSGFALGLGFVAGLTAIAGLLAAFAFMADFKIADAEGVVPLFNAANGASLAGWFSSLLFGLAAVGSLLVYSVRRHKLDDYRGRYRLWLWCAPAWLVMSIDATANLHAPFSQAMTLVTGWTPPGSIALWWIGVWGMIVAILGVRLMLETRECRTAMFSFISALSMWVVALAIGNNWLTVGQHANLIEIGCRLVGQLTLLMSVVVYARHVLLDAEGLITIREPKPKREKPAKRPKETSKSPDGDESSKSTRIDSAHKTIEKRTDLQSPSKLPTATSFAANRSSGIDEDDDNYDDNRRSSYNRHDDEHDEDGSSSAGRKLSKAERKRLRKMKRQQELDEE